MLDMSIRAWEEEAFVAIRPSHQVRPAALVSNLQDLAVSDRAVQRARSHHDPIADLRLHPSPPECVGGSLNPPNGY
jgi:hypothetical protein